MPLMLQQIPSHEDTVGGGAFSALFAPSMLCYAVCLLVKATTHPIPPRPPHKNKAVSNQIPH